MLLGVVPHHTHTWYTYTSRLALRPEGRTAVTLSCCHAVTMGHCIKEATPQRWQRHSDVLLIYHTSPHNFYVVVVAGCCCCCCCCCSHMNSHNQVRGHRTGSSHSGAEEYPREKHKQTKGGARISQLTQLMPPPETYKIEIGSQPTMCQVHIGAYVLLLAPGKTDYTACHPRKTTTYMLHVVPITTHRHNRRKSIGRK